MMAPAHVQVSYLVVHFASSTGHKAKGAQVLPTWLSSIPRAFY